MSNTFFRFKAFTIHQEHCAMKVCTDACLFGAWLADHFKRHVNPPGSILDIGTGTGLLSLMLAQELPFVRIDAVELEEAAAIQAAENVEASPWPDRVQVLQGDIRTLHLGKQYTCIISNPPFYANNLKSPSAARNLALHSEALSLPELFSAAVNVLATDGKLALLLPAARETEALAIAGTHKLWPGKITRVQQTPRHPVFRVMLLLGREKTQAMENTLIIRQGTGYSAAFHELLQGYYEAAAWGD